MIRSLTRAILEALCRVLFTYECRGQEYVPETGAALVAANHTSYLDPIVLSLEVSRPIRFMAWEPLFKVPVVGALMRLFGAFPVDTRPGHGRDAYEKAKEILEAGEVVGIFPEGKRSATAWMEPALREGAARLSLETGALLVPASIAGAFRVWPRTRPLPRPHRISVRFHEPIDPALFKGQKDEEAIPALLALLRSRVERSLLPGVKAGLRLNVLYTLPAPFPRFFEWLPAMGLALLVFWKTRSLLDVAPAYAFIAYLLLDHYVIPQGRLVKWLRNASPLLFLLGFAPVVIRSLALPDVPSEDALAAMLLGALFPYIYEHGRTALGFIRGFVTAILLEGFAYFLYPAPFGPHLALPLYAAAFAWERRTVFWPYATSALALYSVASFVAMGPGSLALPHATAALLAWLTTRVFPYRSEADHPERHTLEGLGLKD
jgi:1-acyl-sn-glycerol-3-phosphate acyltransferase